MISLPLLLISITAIIPAVVIRIYIVKNKIPRPERHAMQIAGSIVSSLILTMIVVIPILCILEGNLKPDNHKVIVTRIASLKSTTEIRGRFFIGSGSIESKPYYYMYNILDDNSYRLITKDALEYSLRETNSKKPGIYGRRYRAEWLGIIYHEWDKMEKVITVPVGTVKIKYESF